MSARDIPGWNSDITPFQEWAAPLIPKGGTYLEVGVLFGASLATLGELRPDISLIAVDPWPPWKGPPKLQEHVDRYGDGDLFLAFLRGMLEHAPEVLRRTRVLRGTAQTIAILEPVDLLFIDGAHDEASVRTDLRTFAPLVRPGGVVAGHDYSKNWPGVVAAVDEYFGGKPNVGAPGAAWSSCWWVSGEFNGRQ